MTRDQAIDKIKKCLRLGKSSNQHEAAAALRQASKLMQQFQLSDEDVRGHQASHASANAGAGCNPPLWETRLANIVAGAFGCEVIFSSKPVTRTTAGGWCVHTGKHKGEWWFVGCDGAEQVAQYAFTVLVRHARRARAEHIAQRLKRCGPRSRTERADLFCLAWVAAVRGKLEAFAGRESNTRAIKAYVQSKGWRLSAVSVAPRSALSPRTFGDWSAGNAAGASVDLNHPINGGEREAIA